MLSKEYLGIPGDECQCGRRASRKHCPFCGSFKLYPYARLDIVDTPEGPRKVMKFRCLAYGHLFNELEINPEFCEAPLAEDKPHLVARQIRTMEQAVAEQHPLTEKEKIIKQGIDSLTEQEKKDRAYELRKEWMHKKVNKIPGLNPDVEAYIRENMIPKNEDDISNFIPRREG